MKRITLDSDVANISGVGPARKKQLEKLGINSVRDLIYNFPRMHENRGNIITIRDADCEASHAFLLTVATEVRSTMIRRGFTVSKFKAFDDTGAVEIVFFNSPFVKDVFHTGAQFRFFGKMSRDGRLPQIANPKYEPYIEGIELPDFSPIYSLTKGVNSKFIEKITAIALDMTLCEIIDPIPENIRNSVKLVDLSTALANIHFPKNSTDLSAAVKRLSFDELFYFALGIASASEKKSTLEGIKFHACDLAPIINTLPYELTDSQKKAINDIYRDTVLGKDGKILPMSRILVGDVGCGKTICAAIAMYISANSGYQSALMAPTEILARQHFNDLCNLFSPLGINVELLLGSTPRSEKEKVYSDLIEGRCQVVVGTHALIADKTSFNNLGLVITDEQHRFGVNQRAALRDKSRGAHMLVMSATPIPRTLALTVYGDLDISRITEMPKGRQRVDTFVVDESYRERLNAFIEKQISAGGQCYIVCPAIERNCDSDIDCDDNVITANEIKNVNEYTEKIRQRLKNINIRSMHGKMRAEEKDEIMHSFSSGETKILISTTVIEVGVNVPNASLIVVENAERFGLAQLHQLRGRVGRGTRKSYCVLVSGNSSKNSTERLNIMKTTYDGFEIAEKDLILRGPGDFFSSYSDGSLRQSGGFEFKIASSYSDTDILTEAFSAAKALIEEDPDLKQESNALIKRELEHLINVNSSIIS